MANYSVHRKPYIPKDRVISAAYPDLIICSLCEGIVWLPKGCTNCEKPYCSSCIKNQQLDSSEPIQCPTDFNCSRFIEGDCSKTALRILSQLEIKCNNALHGCNKVLPYNQLNTHEEICDYQQKQCSGCKKYFAKKDFGEHQNECQLFILTCPNCDSSYERQHEPNHTVIECLRVRVKKLEDENNSLKELKQTVNSLEEKVNSLMKKAGSNTQIPIINEINS